MPSIENAVARTASVGLVVPEVFQHLSSANPSSHHTTNPRLGSVQLKSRLMAGETGHILVYERRVMVGYPRFAASTVGHNPAIQVTRASYALDVAYLLVAFEACIRIAISILSRPSPSSID